MVRFDICGFSCAGSTASRKLSTILQSRRLEFQADGEHCVLVHIGWRPSKISVISHHVDETGHICDRQRSVHDEEAASHQVQHIVNDY